MYSLICGIISWQVVSDDSSGAVAEFTTFSRVPLRTSPFLKNTGYTNFVLNPSKSLDLFTNETTLGFIYRLLVGVM